MPQKITIGQRGVLTLPAALRKRYELKESDELIVEETEEGILLRPAITLPIEMYSEARIAEFASGDKALGEVLDRLKRPE